MLGSEAEAPSVVRTPGTADVPVVAKTLALASLPLGATSATDCCCPENTRGAIVTDEDVAGTVERDTRDARKRQAENDSLLEPHQAADATAGRVDRDATGEHGGVKT